MNEYTTKQGLRALAHRLPGSSALLSVVLGSAVLVGCATSTAPLKRPTSTADANQQVEVPREGDQILLAGVGFTGSPSTALLAGQLDYYMTEEWAIGPMLQLGLSGNDAIVAPTFNVKRVFGMQEVKDVSWRPFAQAGVGLAFIYHDARGSNDDLGLLLNGGGGVEVFLDSGVSLGSTLMFNVMPDKVLGESSFISWQIIQMQFRF